MATTLMRRMLTPLTSNPGRGVKKFCQKKDSAMPDQHKVTNKVESTDQCKWVPQALRGIRTEPSTRNTCAACGAKFAKRLLVKFGPNRECNRCRVQWYVNHCWRCKGHHVDSRDPATPKCSVCGWYKCAHCRACKLDGCQTNPHSRNRLYRGERDSNLILTLRWKYVWKYNRSV